MAAISSTLFKGLLLDYYYLRRAESECRIGRRFQLFQGWFGYSSLVSASPSGAGFDIANIPPDFDISQLQGKFAEVDLGLDVDPNTANMTVTVAVKDTHIQDTAAHKFNTLVLVDDDKKACAVLCCQEDTIYKGKNFTAYITIEQKVI